MNFFRKMGLKTKVMSGICIPLALSMIIGIISIINIKSMVRTREWVEHTHKVIERAERITASAVNMETGMRGYLLAGKKEFLEPYNHGEKATYEFIGSLKKRVSDNLPQVRRLDKAETILRKWQRDVAEPAIAFRREVGKSETMDDIAELIGEARGKRDFDSFRTLMSDFIGEEEYLEKKREGDEAAAVSRTINIIVLCLIVAFVIGLFIAYVLPRNIQKQVGGEPAVIAGIAREIAEGNLHESFDEERKTGILAALAEMVEAIDHIVTDIKRVADNVASGDINARGNAGDFKKGWQDLVSGINTVTESLAGHIDQIPVPVIIIDSDFNILFVNRAGADMLAKTREQIVGQKCYDQFRTSDCQTSKCACARAMRSGNRETGETDAHPAGSSLFISYSGVPVRNQAGKVVGALEVVMDHTDIQKEAWLKAGQNDLNERMRGEQDEVTLTQNILNCLAGCLNVQVGVCYLMENQDSEEDRRLRLVSSFAYKMRNNNHNEFRVGEGLIGQAALEKKSILFAGIPEDHVCMAINSGMGESAARSILVIPLIYEEEVLGVMGFGTSRNFTVTETELLDRVAENIAVSIHSAQSRVRMKELLEKTREQSETLKIQQEELQTNNEELEEQARILEESEQKLKTQSMELQAANAELEEKTELQERQKAALEVKNFEIEEKAEELELASKYKSEFLANMSHELRTPLNSLLILAKIFAENEDGNLTEEQVESAKVIHSGGHDLLNLINDILDLSKIEAGKMVIHIEDAEFDAIIGDLTRQFSPVAKERGVEFRVETGGLPPTLKTDVLRTEQILKNLLSNAFKFTHKGTVTLGIRYPESGVRFSHSDLTRETAVAFSVADTGIGISEEKRKTIFEAFQQADGSTSRQYGGTGLGLTISRELARKLGGEIQMRSTEGEGSVFTLFLPLEADGGNRGSSDQTPDDRNPGASENPVYSERPRPESASVPSEVSEVSETRFAASKFLSDDRDKIRRGDKSILVIEDDIRFARILADFVRKKGYRFLAAGDGGSGLKMASEHSPSGIILDIGLPDTDGLSVLDNLKAGEETRHIPVHIISAQERGDDSLKKGAVGYLTKPVTPDAIDGVLSEFGNLLEREIKELLIVEDDPGSQKAIIRLIRDRDIRITAVDRGEDACQKIMTQRFDCVILDLGLPDMTGFEVLERLGREKPEGLPPVIIYTGRDLTPEEHKELGRYAKSIVIKGAGSEDRLLDEVSLFLHTVESSLPEDQKKIIRAPHDPKPVLKDKKILLADDDFRNTFALSKVLKNYGIKIIMADNGQLALEKLETEEEIDLVIMDIMMPVMDGYEAVRRIRAQERFKDLPVIALTAKAMPEDRAKCLEAGANDYLTKPVDEERLISMLRVWLFGD